jgi:TRAP transporter TAXI family solute receptor
LPFGYEVIQCRNCNRALGPPLVARASVPPELTGEDLVVGTTIRVNAKVDFGITSSSRLAWAFAGRYNYAEDGPLANLRLIAKIEDPSYVLCAVKADSGITDLSQVAAQKLPVIILGGGSPISQPILDHYGLTQEAVTSWGGSFVNATIAGFADDPAFDVLINENASPANNPEASYWTKLSQKHNLRFLDLPEAVLDRLARDTSLGVTRATVKWGFLKGVDRPIATVARSGHSVFARDDMPERAAYDVAKAIDLHRAALRWFIRPYSYDSRTAWENMGVLLHPGAERYYREAGYLPGSETAPGEVYARGGGGCSIDPPGGESGSVLLMVVGISTLFALNRRRRAVRDELTQLYNRRGFVMLAGRQLELENGGGRNASLFLADLQELGIIKARHGDAEADLALCDMANLLEKSFRGSDIIARLEADEFAVLAIDTPTAIARQLETKLRDAIQTFNAGRARPHPLSVGIGFSLYDPMRPRTIAEMLSEASLAMYEARRARRTAPAASAVN